jgi:choline-sulfatase
MIWSYLLYMDVFKRKRAGRWVVAALYTASVFLLIPLVYPMWNTIVRLLTVPGAVRAVNTAVPVIGVLATVAILAVVRERRLSSYLWLAAVVGGYGYLLTLHCEYPVERAHLIQYSVLAYVLHRALKTDCSDRTSLIAAAVLTMLVGTCDEVVQHFVPNRSCTFADMVTNWLAGGLGLVGLMALQRDGLWSWYRRRGALVRMAVGYVAPAVVALWLGGQIWTRYLRPPMNVIVLTIDCLRPDHLGCYGYGRDTTPELDEFARNGTVFTNAFTQAPWTGPGVVSTLSGLYPSVHGVDAAGRTIPEQADTLLDIFRDRGYNVPDLCYLTVDPTFQQLGAEPVDGLDVAELGDLLTVRNWIYGNHWDPFCIWFHYRGVHLPYNPPEEFRVYPPADDPEAVPPPEIEVVQREVIIPRGTVNFSEESKPWLDALYDAQLRELDSFIHDLRYWLTLHHKLKHTLIVVTADHGEELLEHGYIGHGSTAVHTKMFDEVLRVPLILYGPRVVPKGLVIDATAQQVDILPTVCELLGIPVPAEAQGRSLAAAIRGEPMEDVPAFAETIDGGYQAKEDMKSTWYRSVRTRDWKLVTRTSPEGEEFQLYDLATDPGETKDVFADRREKAGEMLALLTEWITMNQDARTDLEMRGALEPDADASSESVIATEIPRITFPADGGTLDFETSKGAVTVRWTGDDRDDYVLDYHVGTAWHTLKGKLPVSGTSKVFGPLPRDGWEPIYQWNPFRLRVRPTGLPDGWSEWISFSIAPIADG